MSNVGSVLVLSWLSHDIMKFERKGVEAKPGDGHVHHLDSLLPTTECSARYRSLSLASLQDVTIFLCISDRCRTF